MEAAQQAVPMRRIWSFFLPLGLSASLVTISHVIINSTLTRAVDPERVIASYAIAMSLLTITERPAVLLRQTCSALVRDRRSFQSMLAVALLVFASILALGMLICYTPLGAWIFGGVFGVQGDALDAVIRVYQVLMFVSLFSGLRCVYHGVIIYHLRTKWLTIGMGLRLLGMYALSQYFIHTGVTSGTVGAMIFLLGMMIEAAVSYAEGRQLVKRMPERSDEHEVKGKRHIFGFYRPLLMSTLITVWIIPVINAMLGKTWNAELAIASFAVAASVVGLLTSFFSYFHQIVLNFYRIDPQAVRRFTLMIGFLPCLLLMTIAYTPIGDFLLGSVIGVEGELRSQSLQTLRAFVLLTLVMPWLDALNGLIMVRGQTRLIFSSQAVNLTFTVLTLLTLLWLFPHLNGSIGAWAQSIGMAAELGFVALALRRIRPMDTVLAGKAR
ncbi:multi antimicrobial extrusion protein MatE [Paenibacillus sp. IB182496]|uniref:Multi antimicrobial extrusion protein MatE n=1 Tax=Paenibacillus sabuli TaxID=2772509 RepID=A0A927GS02_9BACL|nr:multi antimicrobial extrusion protein MatE [Paenibacillus sabuli]MBD2846033.1 multi antimicrobial extrusion protein MatE [Paenibacillus sabuli]